MGSTYTVKNVRTFQGMEGEGFNCSLYRDGKRVALVIDEGCGGCCIFRWEGDLETRKRELKLLQEYAASLPEIQTDLPDSSSSDGKWKLQPDPDMVVGDLVTKYQFHRLMKRTCKNKTAFRLPSDKRDTWRIIQQPYTPEMKEYLMAKFGDTVEIGNEVIK